MRVQRMIGGICLLAVIASAACPQVLAQKTSSSSKLVGDEQSIHDYILTMPKVQRYMDVATRMMAAAASDATLDKEIKKIASAKASNLEKVALADRSPHISSFLKSNNMTARDFVMTPLTLFSALDAVTAEGKKDKPSPFVNPVNIQFVRDHRAEIEKYQNNKAQSGTLTLAPE